VELKIRNKSRICPVPPRSKRDLNLGSKPRTIMAVSLTLILTTSSLVYVVQPGLILPSQLPIPPPEPDKLVCTIREGFSSLEPTRGDSWVLSSFYDTLVSYDRERTDRFRPILVTEVPSLENERISLDGMTYRFTIRNDSPLTPEDIEYSIERAMIRGIGSETISILREVLLGDGVFQTYCNRTGCYYNVTIDFGDIDNAVEANGNDVLFHLAKIYPPFMYVLASSSCSILSRAWCVRHGDWPGTEETWEDYIPPQLKFPPFDSPLDSATQELGPFMLESLTTGSEYWLPRIREMVLVRNEDYWRGPARLERVELKWIDEWETRKKMFLESDADVCSVQKENYAELEETEGIRVYTGLPTPSGLYNGLYFNFATSNNSPYIGSGELDGNGVPPDFFTDIDIRKAFAYSIDYDTIINEIYGGEAQQTASPLLEGLPFHNPDQDCYTYDLNMARQHFQQAWGGEVWNVGFNVTLGFNPAPGCEWDLPHWDAIGDKIKNSIESIHANFTVTIYSDYWADCSFLIEDDSAGRGLFNIEGFDWCEDRFHADDDSIVESLIEASRNTIDPVTRQDIYHELQRRYHEEALGIPLAQQLTRHYQRDWVWGWYYNPAVGMDFYEMLKGTCQDATRNIITHVVDLVNNGVLEADTGSSLTETLDSVIALVDNTTLAEASQLLNNFIDQVDALELPVWDKGELTALAQEIIEVLTRPPIPTPTDDGFDMTLTPLVGGGVAAIIVIVLITLKERIIE
jgi:peptide/nickel transport system substrate-binding protein